jgi:hypothetical protein
MQCREGNFVESLGSRGGKVQTVMRVESGQFWNVERRIGEIN